MHHRRLLTIVTRYRLFDDISHEMATPLPAR